MTVVGLESGRVGSSSGLRVLALDVTGWMDAVLGERCSCASPLSVSLFSVIIDKEVMMRVAQQTRKKASTNCVRQSADAHLKPFQPRSGLHVHIP